ncbi:class I SAM-dependent methyltransferase [Paraneptunicella aestuarii]|uniref:class I SAM-dependent methyltransferase n=1 Tax=Paraneptunicella aestuarii TaxID=2831148 RepID=UPI001E451FB3|nr:methyltransferase [Paraneptunicella aestuarii]UAA39258.1 class I SAM-dependent methyltransferase [Paraneptunicella aestuarii]
MKKLLTLMLAGAASFSVLSGDFDSTQLKIENAMKSNLRTLKEVYRDSNRKPVETLKFFGLREDMRVVELLPGGGWYTKILAPTLKEKGDFYVALNTTQVEQHLLPHPDFQHTKVAGKDAKIWREEGSPVLSAKLDSLGVDNVDMVLTFRNYHSFTPEARMELNHAIFKALKPGGVYGVITHTARHMEPNKHENSRRIDPVKAILEITKAGFVFEDYSDLHYRPVDKLDKEVGDRSVTGRTDRWTFRFRKPE